MSSKKDEALSDMKTNFAEFHQELSKFCSLLATMFLKDAPPEMAHIKLLPAVLTPNDEDFIYADITNLLKKWFYLKDILEKILQKMLPKIDKLVKPEHIQWFSEQKVKLEWWIFVVNMSAAALGLENRNTQAEYVVVSSGIGGVNFGTADARAKLDMLKRERDLKLLLKSLGL